MSNELFSNTTSDGRARRNFDELLSSKRQALLPSIIDKGLNPVLVVYMCLQLLGKCYAYVTSFAKLSAWVDN